jgi:hypothetical protein
MMDLTHIWRIWHTYNGFDTYLAHPRLTDLVYDGSDTYRADLAAALCGYGTYMTDATSLGQLLQVLVSQPLQLASVIASGFAFVQCGLHTDVQCASRCNPPQLSPMMCSLVHVLCHICPLVLLV